MATRSKETNVSSGEMTPLDILTLEEAAEYLRVPVEQIRVEAERGRLPGRRVGSEWRFVRTAIVAWLQPELPATRFTDLPTTDESPAEQQAFLDHLEALRKTWGPTRPAKTRSGR